MWLKGWSYSLNKSTINFSKFSSEQYQQTPLYEGSQAMLKYLNLKNVLFLDIETVPSVNDHEELPANFKTLFAEKLGRWKKDEQTWHEYYFSKAGIYAEFGKIVCISVGIFQKGKSLEDSRFRVKSFYGDVEKDILTDFAKLLNTNYRQPDNKYLCGHNIKEFDVPFICRRMLIHGIKLPRIIDTAGAKPWEVNHIDTLQLWKFGDYKHYTSLNLLAALFEIPTPKDDISGKDVGRVYWEENDLERIVIYCQKDVVTVARLILKLKGFSALEDERVVTVE